MPAARRKRDAQACPRGPLTMARDEPKDIAFEIGFFESVLRQRPRYPDVIEILGGLYVKAGRSADALRMDRRLVRIEPGSPGAHYNLACSLALCRRKSAALASLRRSIELGYRDFEWMSQDPDLDSLRKHPAFIALVDRLKAQP